MFLGMVGREKARVINPRSFLGQLLVDQSICSTAFTLGYIRIDVFEGEILVGY